MTMPNYLMPLTFHLIAALPALIAKAEAAFSGQPGSGAQKKALVQDGVAEILADLAIINPNLLTKAQADMITQDVLTVSDAAVQLLNTVKTFEAQAVPPVKK